MHQQRHRYQRAFDSGSTTPDTPDNEWLGKGNADWQAMIEYWNLTDTIVAGTGAVREAGDTYLPRFPDEDNIDYTFRLQNTKFTNVYRDIIEGLSSKPFEEEVTVVEGEGGKIPDAIAEFVEDVDGAGNNLSVFAASTFFDAINSAIDWIFIDYSKTDDTTIRTVADEKAMGIRPFWSKVLGRNVLEARVKVINGKEVLVYIRIWEPGKPNHVREIIRDTAVTWTLYEELKDQNTGKNKYVVVDTGVFSIGVIPLVPFITGRRHGRRFCFTPMMRDAADLQIELYQAESGLKNIKTLTAFPMLAGNGVKLEMMADGKTPKKIRVGPKSVLVAPPDGNGSSGTWDFISPDAACLSFLAADVKSTIDQLRELGRQPLTAQSGNLTTITAGIAAGKGKSAVGMLGLGLKDTLENALMITCLWMAIADSEYSPEVRVYDGYDDFGDVANETTALTAMRAAGDLSRETYWEEMKRRNVLSAEFDAELEETRLLDDLPGDDIPPEDDKPPTPQA